MVDVTVRGAGIFGLSIAWECARRGASVNIIDPFGAGAGSSGGLVGALAPHVPENWNAKKAFQLDSLLMAEAFWREVEQASGRRSGYRRSGRLQPVADSTALALAEARAKSAETLWQGKAVWQVERASDTDWQPKSPSGWVIRDTLSAVVHPRQAVHALVAALAAKGTTIQADGAETGQTIWATGLHGLEALNADHTRQVGTGVKGQAALLDFDARGAPQLFADTIHIIPHDNGTVAVGSTSERFYDDTGSTDAKLDEVIARARAAVPALSDAPVIDRWAGVRPRARSRAPMLGAWPGRQDHFIANGGFKIGFGMAPKIAQVMAALVLDHVDTIPDGFEVSASF